jgi:chromosome segregation ATPase
LQLIAFQAIPSLQKEGLPYWIFWGMLLVILLLLLFIFLRDRKLRLRLSSFFAGARRRSVLLQLRYKLRKERQKKENVLKRLGEKAWDADIHLQGAEAVRASLKETDNNRDAAQMEGKNAFTEMEKLHKRLEESNALFEQKIQERRTQKQPFDDLLKKKREEERALKKLAPGGDIDRQIDESRKEIADTFGRVQEFERQIREVEAEKRDHQREIAREIHYWKKKKEKVQERIKEIETQLGYLYLSLGRILEEKKVERQELHGLYAEIDLINGRIATLQHRIETLGGG